MPLYWWIRKTLERHGDMAVYNSHRRHRRKIDVRSTILRCSLHAKDFEGGAPSRQVGQPGMPNMSYRANARRAPYSRQRHWRAMEPVVEPSMDLSVMSRRYPRWSKDFRGLGDHHEGARVVVALAWRAGPGVSRSHSKALQWGDW